jgi:hypothetical protein
VAFWIIVIYGLSVSNPRQPFFNNKLKLTDFKLPGVFPGGE